MSMKNILFIAAIIIFIGCKEQVASSNIVQNTVDSVTVITDQEAHIAEDIDHAVMSKDQQFTVKTFYKKENNLVLHYKYPYLNENKNPVYHNFNSYLKEDYLNLDASVVNVLKNDALFCDPSVDDVQRTKRSTDFKIYNRTAEQISILLYKANYYDDPDHISFIFKGINYDLKRGKFIGYNEVFRLGSEETVFELLNVKLQQLIQGNEAYSSCKLLSKEKFNTFKDNFVMDGDTIKFYFDDCTICPSYAGNHYLQIVMSELSSVLQTVE